MQCENCGISDSEQEVRQSDRVEPEVEMWLCQNCFELDPHHSNWDSLKQRPYKEQISLKIEIEMSREAIEHVIELLENNLLDVDTDLENNSISDIDALKELLERNMEEHNFGTGYGEVQIK